jgi:hypothetical protein
MEKGVKLKHLLPCLEGVGLMELDLVSSCLVEGPAAADLKVVLW